VIISRPQTSTIISFVAFLLLTIIVLSMNILVLLNDREPAWYTYLIIALLTPIALFVLYKIFIRYKVVRLGHNRIELTYPVLRSTRRYPLEQIEYWVEHSVKTGKNSLYLELEIKFSDGITLTIGHKEQSEYPRIVQYLTQKAPKKKRVDA
jgi:Ca2+/Na+ antiporter